MKIIEKSNFRVVVEPRSLGDFGAGVRVSDSFFHKTQQSIEKGYMDKCVSIMEDIKRHVDEVGSVTVEYDTEEKCSHCGYSWELDETGEPLCCNKAAEEFNAEKQKL